MEASSSRFMSLARSAASIIRSRPATYGVTLLVNSSLTSGRSISPPMSRYTCRMAKNCPPGCGCGKHVHVVRTFYDKQCLECGGPFVAKRVDARFCSGSCHRQWYERENKDR